MDVIAGGTGCPHWLAFLGEVLDDPGIGTLQEFFAGCLLPGGRGLVLQGPAAKTALIANTLERVAQFMSPPWPLVVLRVPRLDVSVVRDAERQVRKGVKVLVTAECASTVPSDFQVLRLREKRAAA